MDALNSVREALRSELTTRGHRVATDTLGRGADIYVVGPNDLARAVFHIDDDAAEAAMTMYRGSGSWAAGMPPRFAVLPRTESASPSLEMLEQMRAIPLFYEAGDSGVTFDGLDAVLAAHLDGERGKGGSSAGGTVAPWTM